MGMSSGAIPSIAQIPDSSCQFRNPRMYSPTTVARQPRLSCRIAGYLSVRITRYARRTAKTTNGMRSAAASTFLRRHARRTLSQFEAREIKPGHPRMARGGIASRAPSALSQARRASTPLPRSRAAAITAGHPNTAICHVTGQRFCPHPRCLVKPPLEVACKLRLSGPVSWGSGGGMRETSSRSSIERWRF